MKDKHIKHKKLAAILKQEEKRAKREHNLAVADWFEMVENIMICGTRVKLQSNITDTSQ